MLLTRYEPWSAMRQLQNEMSRVFDNAVAGAEDGSNVVTSRWTPTVDIREDAERFVIAADVPGVDPEDIELTMENGVLTIKGERKLEAKDEGRQRLSPGGAGVRQLLSPVHPARHRRCRGHLRQRQARGAGGGDPEARRVAAEADRGRPLKKLRGEGGTTRVVPPCVLLAGSTSNAAEFRGRPELHRHQGHWTPSAVRVGEISPQGSNRGRVVRGTSMSRLRIRGVGRQAGASILTVRLKPPRELHGRARPSTPASPAPRSDEHARQISRTPAQARAASPWARRANVV